tara:strand:- start:18184 stop:18414 length:231 start_codon:yes stop_codon:yes gene_type:complete
LRASFVDRAISVQPTARESGADGIDRQIPFKRDPLAALNEILGTIAITKTEIFQPVDRVKAEPVICSPSAFNRQTG